MSTQEIAFVPETRIGFWFLLPPDSLAPGKYQLYACAPSPTEGSPTCNEHDLEVL